MIRRGRQLVARAVLLVCVAGVVTSVVGMAIAGAIHGRTEAGR